MDEYAWSVKLIEKQQLIDDLNRRLEDMTKSRDRIWTKRDALRAENERQAKAKSQIIKQLNDAWVERDALRAQLDIAVKALDRIATSNDNPKWMIAKNALSEIAKLGGGK